MVPRHAQIGTSGVIRIGTEMLRGWGNPKGAPSGRSMQREWLLRKRLKLSLQRLRMKMRVAKAVQS